MSTKNTVWIFFVLIIGVFGMFFFGMLWIRSSRDVPVTPQSIFLEGKLLYLTSCAKCHGNRGEGSRMAPSLRHSVWTDSAQSKASLATIISLGIPGTLMDGWQGKLQKNDIQKIAYYVANLAKDPIKKCVK